MTLYSKIFVCNSFVINIYIRIFAERIRNAVNATDRCCRVFYFFTLYTHIEISYYRIVNRICSILNSTTQSVFIGIASLCHEIRARTFARNPFRRISVEQCDLNLFVSSGRYSYPNRFRVIVLYFARQTLQSEFSPI